MTASSKRGRSGVVDKVDLKQTISSYRAPTGTFEVIEVPPIDYLAIEGHGDPNTDPLYPASLAALYPVAYKLKFHSKIKLGRDYVVPPLEGLWWAEDMDAFTRRRDKSEWLWTMMILVPDWLNADDVETARAAAIVKDLSPLIHDVRFETLDEGLCVQTLHIGAYDDEAHTLGQMHSRFIPDNGLALTGRHHEIYLSDPRRTSPDKLRTILRQPVRRL